MSSTPTRLSSAIFHAKVWLLRAERGLRNTQRPVPCHKSSTPEGFSFLAAQSLTPLYTDSSLSEQWYQRGKVVNLRLAATRLDHRLIPAGETFSFWRQVGPATRRKGYQPGRMLQGGCVIPSVGGGLCQLSNALFQIALDAGCTIVERHGHSRLVSGSAIAPRPRRYRRMELHRSPLPSAPRPAASCPTHRGASVRLAPQQSAPEPPRNLRRSADPSAHRRRPLLRSLWPDCLLPEAACTA